jgi:signal transduction histidine kinase
MDLLNTVKRATERYKLNLELAQKTAALQTAYEDLKSLDQAKNQFMILINHELKTPLTSVLSYSSLLKESPLNDEQKLFLNRIEKSSWRLKNLIDDVLIVVAGETKTLKTKILTYSALELVSGLAEELTALKDKKNQKLVLSLTDKKLVADQSLISQVMARLIHNAVKFGFENSDIEVTGEQVRPHRYRVQVKNKGPQIKDGLIQKLLSPFYIDEDVMNHSVGMGLGLTICQSLLKAHQSKLELQNIEGGVMVSFEISCL